MRIWALIAGALGLGAAMAQDGGWRVYVDPRFGVAIDYPGVFSAPADAPDNGDGQSFATADGLARLTVYGAHNAERRSPAQLLEAYKTAGVSYSYQQSGRGWFVLSGVKGDAIGYLRCTLAALDVVGCFEIEYPAADAARWAPVVARLGRSLRVQPTQGR